MKKTLLIIAAMAAAFVSCQKETPKTENPAPEVTPEVTFSEVTFEASFSPVTKVALDQETGKVSWTEGDAISIFDGVSNVRAVASEISADGKSAKFKATVASAETYYAVFPYSEANTFSEAVIGAAGATLPSQDGTFAQAHAAAAVTSAADESFHFQNILSLIAFSTERTDIGLVEIAGNGGEALAGAGSIAFSAEGDATFTQAAEGSSVLVGIAKQPGTYFVGVTPAALTSGFTIKFYENEAKEADLIGVMGSTKKLDIAENKIVSLGKLEDHYGLSGAGSEADPWLIRCAYDLNLMRDKKAAQDTLTTEFYKMTRDIDLSSFENWEPIDTRNAAYYINFDGQDHTVKNLTITSGARYPSLFGLACGTIKNLNFEDCNVATASKTPVGVMCGWIGNNGGTLNKVVIDNISFKNCAVSSTAAGAATVGMGILSGCAGHATISNIKAEECSVNNKTNSGNVDGNKESWTGGIVGGTYAVAFENCSFKGDVKSINNNRNTGGIVGKAMILSTTKASSTFDKCSFEGSVSSAADLVGGIVAWNGGGFIKDCSFKGTFNAGGAGLGTAATTYSYSGGIAGYVTSGVSLEISGCSFEGTATVSGKVFGCILGQNSATTTTISNCTVKNTTVTAGQFVGGITGYDQQGTFTVSNCSVEADITVTCAAGTSGGSIVGGILGQSQAGNVTIEKCSHVGTLSALSDNAGGIAGNTNTAAKVTITKCFHKGNITGRQNVGGIVGMNKAPSTITNCYSADGLLKSTTYVGGITGENGVCTIENCYTTMNILGDYGMGGISGRFCNLVNPNTSGIWNNVLAYVLRGCIAWNGDIDTLQPNGTNLGRSPASAYSSGTVLGCTLFKNTLENCYRRPDMTFRAYPSDLASYNTPVDQPNSGPDSPYVKLGSETYYMPYHGKAAAAGQTISDVAKQLGWDETIWDLASAVPTLK